MTGSNRAALEGALVKFTESIRLVQQSTFGTTVRVPRSLALGEVKLLSGTEPSTSFIPSDRRCGQQLGFNRLVLCAKRRGHDGECSRCACGPTESCGYCE